MATKIAANKYRDAIDQVIAYNSKILVERRMRIPYIDGQTGVAQQDCHLWVSRVARSAPIREGQICSYPSRRWRVRRRPDFDRLNRAKVMHQEEMNAIASVASSSSNRPTTRQSVAAQQQEPVLAVPPVQDEGSLSSIPSEKLLKMDLDTSEQFLGPSDARRMDYEDQEEDILSDYNPSDDEFTPGSRRKKKKEAPAKKGKKNALAWKLAERVRNFTKEEVNRMPIEERKKPYLCEICHKRYKNTQGIRYHYQHYDHDANEEEPGYVNEDSQSSFPEKKDATDTTAPAASASAKTADQKDYEQNPYCDFCLGDAGENKKTGIKEELISCSDCGRSGHPSCLQFTDQLIIEVKKYKWQCIECKSCSLCGTSDNDDQLLFCDECDRGYHMYCLTPKMSEPPEGHWCCKLCEDRMKAADEAPYCVFSDTSVWVGLATTFM
eukprot:gene20399-22412_t